jgi:hypothetical protein
MVNLVAMNVMSGAQSRGRAGGGQEDHRPAPHLAAGRY